MTPPVGQDLTGPRPYLPLGLRSRHPGLPPGTEPAQRARVRLPAAHGGPAGAKGRPEPPADPSAAPARLVPLLDWAEVPRERGAWALAGARAWAAARLLMLAGALAVGGTLGLLLAAVRMYTWLRHSGP